MDSFITIIEQKKDPTVTTIHQKQIDLIRKYIEEGKNVFICGSSGVGKTYILNKVLEGYSSVELLPEHLRSKCLFLPFIKPSKKHVYIENYDVVFKSIIERVSDGDKLTRGSLLITTTNMCMYPNFETVIINKHKPEVLMTLTDDRGPHVENAARKCKGNIRNFFNYIEGYDEADEFQTSKEFISDVLSGPKSNEIIDSVSEHGHVWDVFQENYLDSKGVDIIKASNSFSDADFYDSYIYSSGNWNLMPYFVLHALVIPKNSLGEPLIKENIRPGSCWTKYGNYKMRKQKYEEIRKKSRMNLNVEELCLLKEYAHKGDLSELIEYKISPQDFDVINHLAIGNRLKPKEVTKVKKALKNVYERGRI